MKALLNFITNKNISKNNKADYIFYRIVDYINTKHEYVLHCLNTRALFNYVITEITQDITIISGLSPQQACYIGIEYAKYLKSHSESVQKKMKLKTENYLTCRYGKYRICYEDRIKNICFICIKTKEEFLMSPKEICSSEEFIEEFDSLQAYYIGFLAGLRNYEQEKPTINTTSVFSVPYLRIVK